MTARKEHEAYCDGVSGGYFITPEAIIRTIKERGTSIVNGVRECEIMRALRILGIEESEKQREMIRVLQRAKRLRYSKKTGFINVWFFHKNGEKVS